MMGHSHAVSGALLWVAIAPTSAAVLGREFTVAEAAAGALVCAGSALLPDIDHPSASVARAFGPLTQGIAKIVSLLAGGHRQGTHTLLFCIGAGAATWAATTWASMTVINIIMWFLIGLGMKGLRIGAKGGLMAMIVNGALAAGIVYAINTWMQPNYAWLWAAVFIGCVAHLVGDSLTPEGVPWLSPLTRRRFALPVIPHTEHVLETRVLTPLMAVGALALIWINYGEDYFGQLWSRVPFVS